MWNEMSLNKTLQLQQQQQHQHIARKALASFTFNSIYSRCKNFNNVLTQYSVQYYFLTSRDDEFRHLWEIEREREKKEINNKWIFFLLVIFALALTSSRRRRRRKNTNNTHTNNTLKETKIVQALHYKERRNKNK